MVAFLGAVLGLVVGSFLNVCIFRIPQKESIVFPASHCPLCGERLRRYPVVELAAACGWAAILAYYGLSAQGLAGVFLFSLGLVITMIDLEHYIIPNSLAALLLAAGILYCLSLPERPVVNSLWGFGSGFAVLFLLNLISRGGMGGGDIKLSAAMGVWLGVPGIFYALFIAALAGSMVGLFLIVRGEKKRKDPIPFGPFLVSGLLTVFFVGEQMGLLYY